MAPYQPNLRNEDDTRHFEDGIADEVRVPGRDRHVAKDCSSFAVSRSALLLEDPLMLPEIQCWRTRNMEQSCYGCVKGK
jgi:hypothetical protein